MERDIIYELLAKEVRYHSSAIVRLEQERKKERIRRSIIFSRRPFLSHFRFPVARRSVASWRHRGKRIAILA